MSTIKQNGLYAAYLRKSRRDVEMEALGQGETLARHERQLRDLAGRLGIAVSRWYREIVSGDTITERPQVRQLLEDVGAGLWDGVLVVDVDRLGRGDSIDQGVIMQTFMYAGVLIVTPDKIYDPADDADAEFFEIKLFFSRREYGMIKKRMQRGRIASVMDGCYLGPQVYGYDRVKLKGRKGWSLEINPAQADIVRAIFEWYAYGMDGREVGAAVIANRLNDMGVRNGRGNEFDPKHIRFMLQNATYAGKIRWNVRTTQCRIVDGRRVKRRPLNDNPIMVDGLHEAIIPPELFDRVQAMFATHAKRPRNVEAPVVNPLAGLVVCDQCGRNMQTKPDQHRRGQFLFCPKHHCPTCSTYVDAVESVILDGLRAWVDAHEIQADAPAPRPSADVRARDAAMAQLAQQLHTLEGQSGRLYDLLEQGVYSLTVYRERRADLDARIAEVKAAMERLAPVAPADPVAAIIPQVKTVLGAYDITATAAEKNALLRTVIDHVDYHKLQRCYRNNALTDNLSLTLYPRVPEKT